MTMKNEVPFWIIFFAVVLLAIPIFLTVQNLTQCTAARLKLWNEVTKDIDDKE